MYQNLEDYVRNLKSEGKLKSTFLRKVRKECLRRGTQVSIATLDRYCRVDSAATNPVVIDVLTEMTGIAKSDLFRVHIEEDDEL